MTADPTVTIRAATSVWAASTGQAAMPEARSRRSTPRSR
jgi:hypothetical protein